MLLTYKEVYHKQLVKYIFNTSSQPINYHTQSAVQLANGSQLAVFNPKNSSHVYYSCMYLVVYKY